MTAMADTEFNGFKRLRLGRTGLEVGRLGVAASYGVPGSAVEWAFERGADYMFWGTPADASTFGAALKNLRAQRERFVLVIESYTRVAGLLGWSLERALRSLSFDRADVLLLGLWNKPVPRRFLDAALKLKERGLTRFLGITTHRRGFVPELAAGRDFDVVHFRYNAAHPGAEVDIFPRLPAADRPGTVAFTATSWGQLLGKSTMQGLLSGGNRLPKAERVPTAADCYRFVLAPAGGRCLLNRPGQCRPDERGHGSAAARPHERGGACLDAARWPGGLRKIASLAEHPHLARLVVDIDRQLLELIDELLPGSRA